MRLGRGGCMTFADARANTSWWQGYLFNFNSIQYFPTLSFLQAQQNHGEKPHNYGIKVQNNPHLKILQQEIAQIDYQIALTQYNQAYYNRTQGRQGYQNRLRTLQQRKSHLGWLIYKMIVKDPVR